MKGRRQESDVKDEIETKVKKTDTKKKGITKVRK